MESSSSGSSRDANFKPYELLPPVTRPDLPAGKPNIPVRPVGDVGPERAAEYPTRWPAHVQRAIDRRGAAPVRIYVDGIWDLTHCGHFRAMEQAKKALPNVYLMVGCCNDALTHRLKGSTVLTDAERYEAVRACRWVDEVIADAPWVVTDDFIEKHDIDFVAHDALPYVDTSGQSASGDVYAHLKEAGRFLETQRTEGVSTSDLIIRIVKRYDDFVRRNLKRGFSAKDMNVPFLKEKALRLEMALQSQAGKAKAQMARLSEAAEHVQYSFLRLFSNEGADMVKSTLRGLKNSLTSAIGMRSPRGSTAGEEEEEEEDEEDAAAGAPGAGSGAGAGASSRAVAAGSSSSGRKRGGRLAAPKPPKASDAASASSAAVAPASDGEESDAGHDHDDEHHDDEESDGEHAEAASLQRTAAFVLEHTLGARLRRARSGSDHHDEASAASAASSQRRRGSAGASAGAGSASTGVGHKRKASSAGVGAADEASRASHAPHAAAGGSESESEADGDSDGSSHSESAAASATSSRSAADKGRSHGPGRAAGKGSSGSARKKARAAASNE